MKEKSDRKRNRVADRRQRRREKWNLSQELNTFGFVLREYSRARKAIAFNCELE